MKKLSVQSTIVSLSNLPIEKQRETTTSNGTKQVVKYRLTLRDSKSLRNMREVAATFKDRNGNPLSGLGYNPNKNEYNTDLTESAAYALVKDTGLTIEQFKFVCKGATFNADIVIRQAGEPVTARNGESIVIKYTHASPENITADLDLATKLSVLSAVQKGEKEAELNHKSTVSRASAPKINAAENDDDEDSSDEEEDTESNNEFVPSPKKAGESKAAYKARIKREREEFEAEQINVTN